MADPATAATGCYYGSPCATKALTRFLAEEPVKGRSRHGGPSRHGGLDERSLAAFARLIFWRLDGGDGERAMTSGRAAVRQRARHRGDTCDGRDGGRLRREAVACR